MKKVLLLPLFCLLAIPGFAQNDLLHSAKKLKPNAEYDNIHVQRLAGDEGASVFVIWIKTGVRKHKHADHSETVHILKGKGSMLLGDQNLGYQERGHHFYSARNSPQRKSERRHHAGHLYSSAPI